MEDKIINTIGEMINDIDCSNIDRIEILFGDGITDINIEANEEEEDVELNDLLSSYDEEITLKSMMVAVMMSSFKSTLLDFLKGFYDITDSEEKWIEAFNKYFHDVAKGSKKNYYLQVITN